MNACSRNLNVRSKKRTYLYQDKNGTQVTSPTTASKTALKSFSNASELLTSSSHFPVFTCPSSNNVIASTLKLPNSHNYTLRSLECNNERKLTCTENSLSAKKSLELQSNTKVSSPAQDLNTNILKYSNLNENATIPTNSFSHITDELNRIQTSSSLLRVSDGIPVKISSLENLKNNLECVNTPIVVSRSDFSNGSIKNNPLHSSIGYNVAATSLYSKPSNSSTHCNLQNKNNSENGAPINELLEDSTAREPSDVCIESKIVLIRDESNSFKYTVTNPFLNPFLHQ